MFMKKRINKTLVFLLLLVTMSCLFSVPVSALAAEDVIQFQSTSNQDGKFIMPVRIGVSGTVAAKLIDSNNTVIDSFQTLSVSFGTVITYSRSFAGTKTGVYYLDVHFTYPTGEEGFTRRLKINHTAPSAKLTFTETYQTYTDSGDAKQAFKFDYFNAKGKKISFQIYDQYGNLIAKNGLVAKNVNGKCFYNWSYYPSAGGLMVESGVYILKYWVEGQPPKQMNFEVNLAEG